MISRRRFARLLSQGMAAPFALAGAVYCAPAAASTGAPTRVRRAGRLLVFTKSSGFEHDVVRAQNGGASIVERALTALGNRIGYDVTATKDGGRFASEMESHDVVLFYTTGDLTRSGTDGAPPMPASAKDALLRAIDNGLGFVGVHSASDTFHSSADAVDPFIAMLGGEFESHGRPQRASVSVLDQQFPGMPQSARIERHGEWYAFRNLREDQHRLLLLETEAMEGREYRRSPYPVAWARRFGRGRVYYNALGHFAEEWEDPEFLQMLEGGIRWAAGEVEANISPTPRG